MLVTRCCVLKNNKLLKTNIIVSAILLIGFTLTAMFSYQANYKASLDSIEKISFLTAEGIYYQLTSMFTKPLNIALTMAHDSLLKQHLSIEKHYLKNHAYIETTKDYLKSYKEKYGFDSVFLVSTATQRYYNFNGLDRILKKEDPENVWYYNLLKTPVEYSLNIDNDEVEGADNDITVFINCKIENTHGEVIGIVGVGIHIEYLKELLESYEKKSQVKAYLIDTDGSIEISTMHTGYENIDWFKYYGQESIRKKIMDWKKDASNLEVWTSSHATSNEKSYIVTRYIPELSWHLIIEQNTGHILKSIRDRIFQTAFLVGAVVLTVVVIITTVIKNFNKQIAELIEERETIFRKATEELYDTIYELNITKNSYVGERTAQYFASLGAEALPYDEGLRLIAEKQIKEEYREGYISTFRPENVIREYERGNNHLWYEFMISQDGARYYWMRIDAYIFYFPEDRSIHMFTYRKNIDEEKGKERQAEIDEMTGFYTKKATERLICRQLAETPKIRHAFFIFDIDNFKQANDSCGHAFGDFCIRTFTDILRQHFRSEDVLGRIGGDEFVAFIPIPDMEWMENKAKELSSALHVTCVDGTSSWNMSASIGIAVAPESGTDFEMLYKNADVALYMTKKKGKNGFTIYGSPSDDGVVSRAKQR